MKKLLVLLLLVVFIAASFSFTKQKIKMQALQDKDSLAVEREKYFKEVMSTIKDKKDIGCDSVFTNIKTFTGTQQVKAEHLLWIMDYWGKALGVSCTHCHNPANWASEEKQTKQIAREMYSLRVTVNNEILKKIKGLQSATPRINCGTCHQGKILPAK
jgi:Photosynthetic reaction centre cytochrome C subunit